MQRLKLLWYVFNPYVMLVFLIINQVILNEAQTSFQSNLYIIMRIILGILMAFCAYGTLNYAIEEPSKKKIAMCNLIAVLAFLVYVHIPSSDTNLLRSAFSNQSSILTMLVILWWIELLKKRHRPDSTWMR